MRDSLVLDWFVASQARVLCLSLAHAAPVFRNAPHQVHASASHTAPDSADDLHHTYKPDTALNHPLSAATLSHHVCRVLLPCSVSLITQRYPATLLHAGDTSHATYALRSCTRQVVRSTRCCPHPASNTPCRRLLLAPITAAPLPNALDHLAEPMDTSRAPNLVMLSHIALFPAKFPQFKTMSRPYPTKVALVRLSTIQQSHARDLARLAIPS